MWAPGSQYLTLYVKGGDFYMEHLGSEIKNLVLVVELLYCTLRRPSIE